MSAIVQAAARLLASASGRAVPIRSSYSLAPDPDDSFAIVPLRMVSEQFVYAVAFGDPQAEPEIVSSWNPLQRDASFLEPFAATLGSYLVSCVEAGRLPRIWLPHGAALELVELLGHRFRTNPGVGARLQRMGRLCRVLSDEAQLAGQQLVAVASDLLAAHVVTGQSPSEDGHLGALLAWVEPLAGIDVAQAAAEATLEPAAAMLTRTADDRIEQLHTRLRDGRIAERAAREEIEAILRAEALREWWLTTRARRAFWSLGLEHNPLLSELVDESLNRVAWRIVPSEQRTPGRGSIAARLDELMYAQELAEYLDVTGDRVARGAAQRAGRVIQAEVLERLQLQPGRKPCTMRIAIEQDVLRVRRGAELQLANSNIRGRIERIATDGGRTVLTLDIRNGVRNVARIAPGEATEWNDPAPPDLRIPKKKIYRRMNDTRDPRVYGTALLQGSVLDIGENLLTVARNLRNA